MVSIDRSKFSLRGLRVLIAEDDAIAALDIALRVEDLGGEVLGPVAIAGEGIMIARRSRPHLALLDMQLRDGFVTPLATELDGLGVPFALVSGYHGGELERSVLRDAPRLTKPYGCGDFMRLAELLRMEVVRRRAYALWERAGRPDGAAERHWAMAERELASGPQPHANNAVRLAQDAHARL